MKNTKKIDIGFGIFGILLLMVAIVSGSAEYIPKLQNVYENGTCGTCHINSYGGGNLTGYGIKFENQPSHIKDPELALRTIGAPPVKVSVEMSEYVLALQGKYGNGSCNTCHINGNGGGLTSYGNKFSGIQNHVTDPISAIKAIGSPADYPKSPGFDIIMVVGIISLIYLLRDKIKYKR